MKKIWFKRKTYGWGWTPVSWEGWVTILVWGILFVSLISRFDHEWLKNLLFVLIMTIVLIYICYKKGESPKWQWGETENKDINNKNK